ncbi:MAG TPA: hypothetical protein VH951_12885, partial [Dehalococcoidia bacterium]
MSSDPEQPDIVDIDPGLWIWRIRHWQWREGVDWQPVVTSVVAELDGERLLIDPVVPPAGATEIWQRLDAAPPTAVVVLKPDH